MTAVWVLGTVAACVMILGGFTAMGDTDSIPTGIIVLGCSWMVLTGLHKVGGWTRTDRACLSGRAHSPTVDGDYPVLRCDPLIVYGGIF